VVRRVGLVLAGLGALMAMAVAQAGCDMAQNYLDPEGPRYVGDHAGPPPAAGAELLLVSYNLANAEAIDRAIAVLSAPPLAGADVLLMQEMDAPGCERVAAALKLRYVYYPASVSPRGRDFGTAVLTRHPITSDRKLLLPHGDPLNGRRRNATAVTLDIGGRPLAAWSVHTSIFTLGLGARLDQAQAVADAASRAAGTVVVGGDFNTADPGSGRQTVALFAGRGLTWSSAGTGDTAYRAGLGFVLDYLFTRGPPAREAGVWRGDAGSDHQPVWVRLAPLAGTP
jgi:endonuclease/exonuclease/phosphatase (EEP) superfamily protein YafD